MGIIDLYFNFREKDICKSETTEVLKRTSDSLHIIAKNTSGSKKNRFSKGKVY